MQYIITELECLEQNKVFEFLLDDDRNPLEIYTSVDDGIQVSDIYSGKVEKVMKNTSACFVNIGGETVFLKYKDSDSILYSHKFSKKPGIHENDEVVIQIKNAALKTKNPTATTHISLETKHLLLSYGESGIHVSKSIKQDRRESILSSQKNTSLSDDDARLLSEVAIIVRSNAIELSDDQLADELVVLLGRFREFMNKAIHTNPFVKLVEARKHYIDRILHAKEPIEKVVTDNERIYNYLLTFKDVLDVEIEYYQDDFSLGKLFSLNARLDNALSRYVYLKNGANITIDSTEAMNVIDVNSASSSRVKTESKDEYFYQINRECALEIAKQIRLRNLSGIIIVDFINMKNPKYLDEIMELLRMEFRKDPLKVEVVDKTKLGLIEITREKKYPSLKQMIRNN